jgi:hypothetical protein
MSDAAGPPGPDERNRDNAPLVAAALDDVELGRLDVETACLLVLRSAWAAGVRRACRSALGEIRVAEEPDHQTDRNDYGHDRR